MKNYTFFFIIYASGSPGISVEQHGRFASAVGLQLVQTMFPNQWQNLQFAIAFLLSTHDVGKISPQFQSKCSLWLEQNGLLNEAQHNAWSTIGTSHACLSQEILDYFWQQRGKLKRIPKMALPKLRDRAGSHKIYFGIPLD